MNFTKFKFRNRLLLTLIGIFIPLVLLGSILAYYQVKKSIQANIERQLQDSTDTLAQLIQTSVSVSIKNRLQSIAEKNLEIAQLYHQKYSSGLLTKDQAIKMIQEIYLSQTIGENGYIYCLNSSGTAVVHPDKRVKGSDISHLDYVQKQLKEKKGYLEYHYTSSKEAQDRPKAIFMVYFEPLDWIISVISYPEDVAFLAELNDFKSTILSFKFGQTGYAYVLDKNGAVIIHPRYLAGQSSERAQSAQILVQILEKKSGKIRYFWKNPQETVPREKIVIFKHLPEFDWYVASSSYVSEVFSPLATLRNYLIVILVAILSALIWLAFFISAFVTNPLEKMMATLGHGAKGDYSVRMDEKGSVEFVTLCQHFNTFMQQLEENDQKIAAEIQKNIESQTALVENDLKLRSLFDQSFQYIGILSPFGVLEQVNQSATDSLNVSLDEILYRPFWEAGFWQHDKQVQQQLKAAIQRAMKGEFVRYETTCISKQGELRDIDLSVKPVFLPSGDVAFIITEGRDITDNKLAALERKDLAVQLERSQKMEAIGTLAGGIAHDFNNILSGIFGYAQLAELTCDNPKKVKNHIKQISRGIQRASELTQQILTFSRQTEFKKQALKLHLVIKETIKLMRSSIPSTIEIKEVILSKEMILADPTQMHQVIMNLCTNAYHAMNSSGGILTVQLQSIELSSEKDVFKNTIPDGRYLELNVRDTGHGMAPETFAKAFDPYFTTKGMGKGTGFGLALVHAIVDEHGGYINAKTQMGDGTSFYIYLPVIQSDAHQDTESEEAPTLEAGSEYLMVVDDEMAIRNVLEEFLSTLGYHVATFENGKLAMDAFNADPDKFDLIITDMTMPKMTGDLFAKQVLSVRKDIPIILCSGYSETISESQAYEIGIQKYVQKPVDNRELSLLIRLVLDQ